MNRRLTENTARLRITVNFLRRRRIVPHHFHQESDETK